MKKNIKDYLPYYIGQSILICEPNTEPIPHYLEGYDANLGMAIAERVNYPPEWIKLLLLSIFDISDETFTEVVFLHFGEDMREIIKQKITTIKRHKEFKQDVKFGTSIPYSGYDENGKHQLTATLSTNSLNPEQFIYLLNKGYDLFNLIYSNLAINRIKKPIN